VLRDYELMYIARPELDDDALRVTMESVETIVAQQGGEVVRTTPWGKRRLAYEIERMRDGHYVLLEVRLDGAKVKEIDRLLTISDTVFRHMITIFVPHKADEDDGAAAAPAQPEAGVSGDDLAGVAAAADDLDEVEALDLADAGDNEEEV